MPSANKMTPVVVDLPEVQGRYAELDSYTVGFESYPMTPTRPRSSGACPTTGANARMGRRPDRPGHLPVGRPRGDVRRRRRLLRRARPPAAGVGGDQPGGVQPD